MVSHDAWLAMMHDILTYLNLSPTTTPVNMSVLQSSLRNMSESPAKVSTVILQIRAE